MGLLSKAEAVRNRKLHKVNKEKKKYIHQVSPARKKAITQEIRKKRKKIVKHLGKELTAFPKSKKGKAVKVEKGKKVSIIDSKVVIKPKIKDKIVGKIKGIKKAIKTKIVPTKNVGAGIVWTAWMSVGDQTIDNQHRALLAAINELTQSISKGVKVEDVKKIILAVNNYVKEHFVFEEKYMKENKYPALKEHQKFHKSFATTFKKIEKEFNSKYSQALKNPELLAALAQKIREHLGQWWVNHIMVEDHKYFVFIEKSSGIKHIKEGDKFKWVPSLSVGDKTIDQQHQKLLEFVNKLKEELNKKAKTTSIRETINFLSQYMEEHLSYEEGYMERIGYPQLKQHQKVHQKFTKFFAEFKKEVENVLSAKTVSFDKLQGLGEKSNKFLGEWFVNHIMVEDHKYFEYSKRKELSSPAVVAKEKTEEVEEVPVKDAEVSEEETPTEELATEETTKPTGKKLFDLSSLKAEIQSEFQRKHKIAAKEGFIYTGIPGFDDLLDNGIPKNASVLVAGGAGSGKTIFCLQTLFHHLAEGKKCIMMSFEESEEKLISHMEQFGWNPKKYVKKKQFYIKRFNPFEITRSVDALLMQAKGELMIKVDPLILPKGFKPDFIVVDSLTAIASAFTAKDESYRIYIEQLFRFFENINATALLITETEQVPKIFSTTGVEEFLADGVIIIYNIKHGNIRERAIEILKLRGASHQNKIVAMSIGEKGVTVYPEQEVFGEIQGP